MTRIPIRRALLSVWDKTGLPELAAVAPCSTGYQHASICCETQGLFPATCGSYPTAPFAPCPTEGYQTYPNPRLCCPLDGSVADCTCSTDCLASFS